MQDKHEMPLFVNNLGREPFQAESKTLPPISVTIQSGMAKLIMANTSAAKNKVPDIIVNLSILIISTQFRNKQINSFMQLTFFQKIQNVKVSCQNFNILHVRAALPTEKCCRK